MRAYMVTLWGLVIFLAPLTGKAQEGAESVKQFAITPAAGNFVICAASFSGDLAAKQAFDLVREIRADYKLPAYVFNRGADLRRQQDDQLEMKRKQQLEYLEKMGLKPDMPPRIRKVRIEDQYAVLVGGFSDMDAAWRDLARIKKLPPPKSVPKDVITYVPSADEGKRMNADQQTVINPFAYSFVSRNPTVPLAKDLAPKVDPFWKQLNSGESFSVFKCKKSWTLAVTEFQATAIVQPTSASSSFLEKLFSGGHAAEELNGNAQNAHILAEALTKLGYESYVLHTRSSSIVTVGGFDAVNDPRMETVIRSLQSNVKLGPNINMFARPLPMPVPR